MCYHQYEDWGKLLRAAEQEAAELNEDCEGSGTAFLTEIGNFRKKFALKQQRGELPPVPPDAPADEEARHLRELIIAGETLEAGDISRLLDEEQQGKNRPAVLIALRQLYRDTVKPNDQRQKLNEQNIMHKVEVQEARTRRNFVRRVYRANRLFALEEIRQRYPGYPEAQLPADLRQKRGKPKQKKRKPVNDLRGCQLQKLAHLLQNGSLDEQTYHDTCNRIVLLQNAHLQRLPIPLAVKLQGETLVYTFAWRTREEVVKSFVELANRKAMTHATLHQRYEEMVQSNYSY